MKIRRFHVLLAMLAAMTFAVATSSSSASAEGTSGGEYVSLGDSFTSASGVLPIAPGAPFDCTQSAVNYPHVVAQQLGLGLKDVSCGGATVQNMTTPQFPDQPAQFNALKSSTSVVSLGIGGNDNGLFASAIAACGGLNVFNPLQIGAPCKSAFGSYFDTQIDADAPNIAAAIQRIHELSPAAKVFVVGYPQVLPQSGSCYPQIPLTSGDVAYLNGIEKHLNSMLEAQATTHAATFVDTFTSSAGHDACKSASIRWVEPFVPGSPNNFVPIHPNAAGEAATTIQVKAAFQAAGIS